MRFYELSHAQRPRCSGGYDEGHKWNLPGIHCPVCDATWAATGLSFPSAAPKEQEASAPPEAAAKAETQGPT